MLQAPKYLNKPIRSIRSLALALGVEQHHLLDVANDADRLYRTAKQEVKSDGTLRQTYDALPRLKRIHARIQTRIFSKVSFPDYLTGSLKGQSPKTNAAIHLNANIFICEDIAAFFPSTSGELVYQIWVRFFGFAPEVASLLTRLTTLNGALPQGAKTSSYLANLALWDVEPNLANHFAQTGIRYSRYVDDVTISSKSGMSQEQTTSAIADIYGALHRKGYTPKRRKHELMRGNRRMTATKLVVSDRVGLPKDVRSAIRSKAYELEKSLATGDVDSDTWRKVRSAESHVARLAQHHPQPAKLLKQRLAGVKDKLRSLGIVDQVRLRATSSVR